MNMITRHNYEEYFILYMDNELGAEDRRKVEAFVQLHPDLKEELDLLLQYKMQPDDNVVFNGKEELMKIDGEKPILLSNYEEWLILYNDNELTPAQRTTAEEFMTANPVFKAEQELLLKTKLQPETISFPGKESLYRKEEKIRRMPVKWWRMAAAAVLLIGVAVSGILLLNNNGSSKPGGVAKGGQEKTTTPKNNPSNIPPTVNKPENNIAVTETQDSPVRNTVAENKDAVKQPFNTPLSQDKKASFVKHNEKQAVIEKNQIITPVQENKPEKNNIAFENGNKPSNNLPSPENNPLMNPKKEDPLKNSTANLNPEKSNPEEKVISTPTVTPANYTALQINNPEEGQPLEEGDKNRKNRGLLRKLGRTLVKRSNASTKDDENDSKLLVGGFAFRLK